MPRGKKTDNETIYKIMISMFTTNNFSETARQLEMAESTVEKIYKENKDKPEFVKLCEEKKDQFVETATRIIEKATTLLEKRIDVALDNQSELNKIIDDIEDLKDKDANYKRKQVLVNKIQQIQLNKLSELTTAIGTLYDKRALSQGNNTARTSLDVNIRVVE